MTKLLFPAAEVRKLYEHARDAPRHGKAYGERGPGKPQLMIVKDDGIYLMSNGEPRLLANGTIANLDAPLEKDAPEAESHNYVVYALGYNPKVDGDVWNKSRAAAGGDDFGEHVEIDVFKACLEPDCESIYVEFTATQMKIGSVHKPKAAPPPTASHLNHLPRAFVATGNATRNFIRDTPRQAARALLEAHPRIRKLSVDEVSLEDGNIKFVIGDRSYAHYRDLSKAQALALPDERSKHGAQPEPVCA